jgi:ubiquinone biosynthesis protein UbiJ
MAMTEENKQEVIQRLLIGKQKAHILETSLRFKGEGDEADKVAQKASELSNQIDTLLAQVLDDWLGQTDAIIQGIKKSNTSLQQSIRKIQQGVKTTENLVKAIGFLDDLIAIATQIASSFV